MNLGRPAEPRLAGLVLAAGRSRRMGGALKQTLPWPASRTAHAGASAETGTVIASAFDAIGPYCARMFVVAGHDAPTIVDALRGREYTRVDADSDAEMFDSIRSGIDAIAMSEPAFDAILLQPGDHPGVRPSTIESLLHARRGAADRAIMPEFDGRGGHPALIPMPVAQRLTGAASGARGGLRQVWIDHPDWRVRVAVDDATCVLDLDTPEDYAAALRAAGP